MTAGQSRTRCSMSYVFMCAAIMLASICMGSTVTAGDSQSAKPHSLIHRQTPENAAADVGVTRAGTAGAPAGATRPAAKKLTKRPADSGTGQSAVTTQTPSSSPSSATLMQGSRTGTETRASTGGTGLAALGASMLSTVPLANGSPGSVANPPAAPSAGKAPVGSALAGVNSIPSAMSGSPAAAGRGFQRLTAEVPSLTQLIAPTVSVSNALPTPTPSPANPSSGQTPSPAPASSPPSAAPTPPPPTPAGTGSATLSWSLNSETDLAGYKIYVGTAPGSYTYPGSPFVVGVTGTYAVVGLPSGQTYYFAISAYDYSGGESALSAEVSKSIY